jgi:hypothetical protein
MQNTRSAIAAHTALLSTAMLIVCVSGVLGAPVTVDDLRRAISGLSSPTYDLSSVRQLLSRIESTLSRSPEMGQRLYYPVGQSEDHYIRFRDLRELCRALTEHAVEAAKRKEVPRTQQALLYTVDTMLLIASAPAPPKSLPAVGKQGHIPGNLSAGEPLFELGSSGFLLTAAVNRIGSVLPKMPGLRSIFGKAGSVSFVIFDASKRLKRLVDQKRYDEYARESRRALAEVRSALVALRQEMVTQFKLR